MNTPRPKPPGSWPIVGQEILPRTAPRRVLRPQTLHSVDARPTVVQPGDPSLEQLRLVDEATHLAEMIHEHVDYPDARHLLEIGCGVGAQIGILRRRFPRMRITGIDRSPDKLLRARQRLSGEVAARRVTLLEVPGATLPFDDRTFTAAFSAWPLSQMHAPEELLADLRRVLADGAVYHATELLHASLFTQPHCPALTVLVDRICAQQVERGGDPQIGARLGGLLHAASFLHVTVRALPIQIDRRTMEARARSRFFDYWRRLYAAAVPSLVQARRIDEHLLDEVEREMSALERNLDAVFFVAAMQARAVK